MIDTKQAAKANVEAAVADIQAATNQLRSAARRLSPVTHTSYIHEVLDDAIRLLERSSEHWLLNLHPDLDLDSLTQAKLRAVRDSQS